MQVARFQRIFLDAFSGDGFGPIPPHEPATPSSSCNAGDQQGNTKSESVELAKNPTDTSTSSTSSISANESVAPRGLSQAFEGPGTIFPSRATTANVVAASATVYNLLGDIEPQALLEADEQEMDGSGRRIKTLGLRCVLARSPGFSRKEGAGHEKILDGEDSISCYDLRLTHFYSHLCRLFLIPLFPTEAGSFELVSKLRSSLQPKLGSSVLDEESHRLLAQSLSSPIPPALLLRVALVRLQSVMPKAHPDRAVSSSLSSRNHKL